MIYGLILPAGVIFALDQTSKRFIARRLPLGQFISIGKYLHIRHIASTGLGGLVQSRGALVWLWSGLLGLVFLLLRQGFFFQHPSTRVALGMALGGAASNLHDQVRTGKVVDFLDIAGWPVFNLADAAITVGALSALWLIR